MKTTKNAKRLGLLGISLCVLCCTLPVAVAAIGIASVTAFFFYLEKLGLVLILLSIFLFIYAWYIKYKKLRTANTDSCSGVSDCKTQKVISE